jgi:hypothetical protein
MTMSTDKPDRPAREPGANIGSSESMPGRARPGTVNPDATPIPERLPGQDEDENQGLDGPYGDARDAVEGPVGFASLKDPSKTAPAEGHRS